MKRRRRKTKKKHIDGLIPTGSTMLNLTLSDSTKGGWQKGKIANLIGDSSSGKTFLALSTLAECCYNPDFDNYRLIYDDVEAASEFDLRELFGDLADRIEPPARDEDGEPVYSNFIQDFHYFVLDALEDGRPFIYILDSLDALDAKEDQEKIKEQRDAHRKGTKAKGTYGMAKAKGMSSMLRNIKRGLKDTDSFLLIVSQVRENLDPMSFAKKKRAGGKALKFYCTHEVWMSHIQAKKSKGLVIGTSTHLKCTKNKLTGKVRESQFEIFYDYGIDDIGSMVDFLVDVGVWKKKKASIVADGLGITASRKKLIQEIEENGLQSSVREMCGQAWLEREKAVRLKRKRKYG